jgi:hypothetical protein
LRISRAVYILSAACHTFTVCDAALAKGCGVHDLCRSADRPGDSNLLPRDGACERVRGAA